MTQPSEFEKIVLARMAVTGERYTPAKLAVLEAARAAIPVEVDPAAVAALKARRLPAPRPQGAPQTTVQYREPQRIELPRMEPDADEHPGDRPLEDEFDRDPHM